MWSLDARTMQTSLFSKKYMGSENEGNNASIFQLFDRLICSVLFPINIPE